MEDKEIATEITLHLNFGDSTKEVTVKLEELNDEELLTLYESGFQDARYVLRERTGEDPAVNIFNITREDVAWHVDWLKRNGKYDEYVAGNGRA
jgi:hypothetical protein